MLGRECIPDFGAVAVAILQSVAHNDEVVRGSFRREVIT
jgi:hypothetical protein